LLLALNESVTVRLPTTFDFRRKTTCTVHVLGPLGGGPMHGAAVPVNVPVRGAAAAFPAQAKFPIPSALTPAASAIPK
jgi:hypothetical protein